MRYRMSVIYGHPVIAATRALRFADHVTKRNGGSGDENAGQKDRGLWGRECRVKFLLSMLRALLRYIFEPRLNWCSFKRPCENDVKTKAHKNGFV